MIRIAEAWELETMDDVEPAAPFVRQSVPADPPATLHPPGLGAHSLACASCAKAIYDFKRSGDRLDRRLYADPCGHPVCDVPVWAFNDLERQRKERLAREARNAKRRQQRRKKKGTGKPERR